MRRSLFEQVEKLYLIPFQRPLGVLSVCHRRLVAFFVVAL
jgi:hypothetical protein